MIPKSFEDHLQELEEIPVTWVPGLLGALLKRAKREKIFKDTPALSRFVDLTLKGSKKKRSKWSSKDLENEV